jgi:DNA polymerase IV
MVPRSILHVDMDAFFAAIEQRDRPELRGRPVLVGGAANARGVVATASYEARVFGARSAMPMATAVRLCPHAVVVAPRLRRYREVSVAIFHIFDAFTPLVEPVSVDEAFLDVTGCEGLFGPAEEMARRLKARIRAETGLTASVGVAPNKFLAKLGSDLEKPDGLVIIAPERAQAVLDALPVSRLWGVGQATLARFERLGVRTVADVRQLPLATLTRHMGSAGEHFMCLARGEDDRPVTPDHQAKSISHEVTFPADVAELDTLRRVLLHQTEDVAYRLRRHDLLARTVTLKVRLGDFTTLTRAATLAEPTQQTNELWRAARDLLLAWHRGNASAVRLIGVAASQFADAGTRQLSLFAEQQRRDARLDAALDALRARFGADAVRRGGKQR